MRGWRPLVQISLQRTGPKLKNQTSPKIAVRCCWNARQRAGDLELSFYDRLALNAGILWWCYRARLFGQGLDQLWLKKSALTALRTYWTQLQRHVILVLDSCSLRQDCSAVHQPFHLPRQVASKLYFVWKEAKVAVHIWISLYWVWSCLEKIPGFFRVRNVQRPHRAATSKQVSHRDGGKVYEAASYYMEKKLSLNYPRVLSWEENSRILNWS